MNVTRFWNIRSGLIPCLLGLVLGFQVGQAQADSPTIPPAWWAIGYDANEAPKPKKDGTFVVLGQVSFDETEAHKDAMNRLRNSVRQWLQSDVGTGWNAPDELITPLIRERFVLSQDVPADSAVAKELSSTKTAGYLVDFSPARKQPFIAEYERAASLGLLQKIGGVFAGILTLLATIASYIRADESTKGYFTAILRTLAGFMSVGTLGAIYYFVFS